MTGGRMRAAAATGLVCVAVLLALPAAAQPERPRVAGEAIVFILDASGSMRADDGTGRPRMDTAREALRRLAVDLPEDLEVGLRVFGHRVDSTDKDAGCEDTELVVPVAPLDRDRLVTAVDSFEPRGFTPLGRSLQEAAADLGARPGTIILVSDGIDTCAPPDPCEVARSIMAEGVDVRIETIGFQVDAAARTQLACVADAGQGEFREADSAEELAGALRAYVVRGEQVAGGATPQEAPLLVPGRYRDVLELGAQRWYAVEPAAGQSVRVELVLAGPADAPQSDTAVFRTELRRGDLLGDLRCDRQEVVGVGGEPAAVEVAGPVIELEGAQCSRHGRYLLPVSLLDGRERVTSPDPLLDVPMDLELVVSFDGEAVEPVVQPSPTPRRAVLPPAEAPAPHEGAPVGVQLAVVGLLAGAGYGTGALVARRSGP